MTASVISKSGCVDRCSLCTGDEAREMNVSAKFESLNEFSVGKIFARFLSRFGSFALKRHLKLFALSVLQQFLKAKKSKCF